MDELYIDNLDEYIQDEGQLVTYKWLSLTLNVPCNTAKQMLFHYVKKQRNSDKNVHVNVTYLISGVIYDEVLKQDIHKVCVVGESKLNDLKETFKCLFSVHIFSVQKAQLHDLNVLYIADYDKVRENVYETSKYSGIICPSIQIRSSDEINLLKSKLAYKSSSPTKSIVGKGKSTLETKQMVIDVENKENKFDVDRYGKLQETEKLQNNLHCKKNVPISSKGGIASMFAIQTKKNEDKKAFNNVINSNIKVHPEEVKKPKKGALSSFFTKGAIKPKNQDQNSEDLHMNSNVEDNLKIEVKANSCILLNEEENPLAKSPVKVETKACVQSIVNFNTSDNKPKQEKKVPHLKPKDSSINSNGCKTYKGKRKPNKEASLSNNKRRRIMAMDSSSESSCEEIEEMDEDPMPAPLTSTIESDDEDVFTPTPQNSLIDVVEMAKVKKRKLVSKTFMDEQGFFVTKKEYELTRDCSDEENPLPSSNKGIKSPTLPVKKQTLSPKKKTLSPKKKTLSPRKKRKSPVNSKKNSPVKRVQASITSFFKRN